MYSVEERVFYIERMWAEGLRPTTASRLWGRPGRACLAEWERQALSGELPAKRVPVRGDASGHRKHEKYGEETKSEAIRLVSSGKSAGQAAKILGVAEGTVGTWVRAARNSANMSSGEAREKKRASRVGRGDVAKDEESGLRKELDEANRRIEALVAVLADPKVGGLARLSNRQKVELGERLRRERGLPLREVISLLDISKSTYEYNRKRLGEPERGDDSDIEDAVVETFEVEGGGARGYRFVCAELRRHGVVASEKRVRRVMRRHGLVPRALKASKRWSSYEGEVDDGAPNLLIGKHGRHVFSTRFPGALWLTDVSEFSVPAGKAYLSPIIDCFDGAVVSWSVSRHPDAQLTDTMLEAAVSQLPAEGTGPVLHSDYAAENAKPQTPAKPQVATLCAIPFAA